MGYTSIHVVHLIEIPRSRWVIVTCTTGFSWREARKSLYFNKKNSFLPGHWGGLPPCLTPVSGRAGLVDLCLFRRREADRWWSRVRQRLVETVHAAVDLVRPVCLFVCLFHNSQLHKIHRVPDKWQSHRIQLQDIKVTRRSGIALAICLAEFSALSTFGLTA